MLPTPGNRLGPYEVVALLGAGGIGEMYRANDPRLGRDVSVQVLQQHLCAHLVRRRAGRRAGRGGPA